MRVTFLLLFLLSVLPLRADRLYDRLRQLLPGTEAAVVNERQYLYGRITDLFRAMEQEERVHRKRKKKRIKRIRKYLGKEVLIDYDASAGLTAVFQTGRYNFAAATVLTALCLEEYEVEYHAYVDHWKAYLMADPGRRDVRIFYGEDEKNDRAREQSYRQDYLGVVRETILPELPMLAGDEAANAFYENHYRPGKRLTFGQLVAYYQYTGAQAAYAAGRYPEAIELAEYALQREKRAAFLILLEAARTQLNAEVAPRVAGDISTLFSEWSSDPDNRYLPAAILRHFDEQQRLVLASNNPGATAGLLNDYLLQAPAGQITWRTQMRELQQLRLLGHHYKTGERAAAEELARRLYAANPGNAKFSYLLGEIIVDDLRSGATTGEAFRNRMTNAAREYPFLNDHPRFIDLYLREQALKVRDLYAAERPDLAGPALQTFRESLLNLSIGQDRNLWTLTAFAAASYYHFRIEDYRGAVTYIEEGLRYAPDDQYLLHRLSVLQKYL